MALKKLKIADIPMWRGDAFDVDFGAYLGSEVTSEVHSFFRERKYNVGEAAIPYRIINHWDEKGIIASRSEGKMGWRKFSFVELVWLKVVFRLRIFGFPIEKIAKAKAGVMSWDEEGDFYPLFEYYIAKAIGSDVDSYVFTLKDGSATVASSQEIEMHKMTAGSSDALLISLKAILQELGLKVHDPKVLFSLNAEEIELLDAIRSGENSEIKIGMASNVIRRMETLQTNLSTEGLSEIERQIKDGGLFGEVTKKFGDGKKQSAEVRKVKRFKNATNL